MYICGNCLEGKHDECFDLACKCIICLEPQEDNDKVQDRCDHCGNLINPDETYIVISEGVTFTYCNNVCANHYGT